MRWLKQDTVTINGTTFHVPAKAHDNSPFERGVVLHAGPGAYVNGHLRPMQLAEGDVVWFVRSKGAAQCIPYDGITDGEVYMTSEENCLAVLTELDQATGLFTPSGEPAVIASEPS